MARPKNQLKTVSLPLSTTEPIELYLEQLVDSGLYGKNTTEAAERLLAASIKGLLAAKELVPLKGKKRRE